MMVKIANVFFMVFLTTKTVAEDLGRTLVLKSRSAWSALVWPPDMILVIIMDKITLCCEETQGFDLVFGNFVF